jgi:FMN phosphatase YigB (HAD superfamily)
MSERVYDLYLFDLGNVILDNIDVVPQIKRVLKDKSEAFVKHYQTCLDSLMTGRMGAAEFWDLFSRQYGIRVTEDYLRTCFQPRVNLDMVQLLEGLQARGCRIVCGTNTYESHYNLLKSWDVLNLFDKVYASHLMGLAKPDCAFYAHILRQEQVAGEKVFFTDDLHENIEAAKECLIDAYLFSGPDSVRHLLSG